MPNLPKYVTQIYPFNINGRDVQRQTVLQDNCINPYKCNRGSHSNQFPGHYHVTSYCIPKS